MQTNTKKSVSKTEMVLMVIGVSFGLVGLLSNEYFSNIFLGHNWAESLPFRVKAAIWIVNISLITWGIATIIFRKKPFVVNGNLALISLFIITPLVGELFIRSAIALQVDFFRNPHLYASWIDDEDLWKLRYQWQQSPERIEAGDFVRDPLLGWAPAKSAENPLGILANEPYTPDFTAKTVLFYGDSYVYGMDPTPIKQRVPQQLDRLLPDYPVYNYGVVGYGLDQIYLRFRQTHADFENPFIIVGMYTLDIDRSFLKVREVPKPYFEVENDRLVLKGIPVADSMAVWLEQHPLNIHSYFWAFIVRTYRLLASGFQPTEMPYNQEAKKALGTRLIQSIVDEAKANDLPLLFVIFYREEEFGFEGWRELLLKELFTRLKVPYVDTKAVFLQQAAERSLKIGDFYDPRHDHLNELGSQVVAEAIAAYFEQNDTRLEAIPR